MRAQWLLSSSESLHREDTDALIVSNYTQGSSFVKLDQCPVILRCKQCQLSDTFKNLLADTGRNKIIFKNTASDLIAQALHSFCFLRSPRFNNLQNKSLSGLFLLFSGSPPLTWFHTYLHNFKFKPEICGSFTGRQEKFLINRRVQHLATAEASEWSKIHPSFSKELQWLSGQTQILQNHESVVTLCTATASQTKLASWYWSQQQPAGLWDNFWRWMPAAGNCLLEIKKGHQKEHNILENHLKS